MPDTPRPAHHGPDGKYRIPWPMEDSRRRTPLDMLKWMGGRLIHRPPPDPNPADLPRAEPRIATPRAAGGEIRITWVGHATFLIQAGGANILTDPHWSRRASPSQRFGPARFVPPGVAFDALPPIDAVLLSHDHYDHLDEDTVRRLNARFGKQLNWIAPLGHKVWLEARGIENAVDVDWWDETEIAGEGGSVRVTCAPAQHWTRRALREYNDRLWASFALALPDGRRVYFGGDSGYFGGYGEIGRRLGPFDVVMMPIGAYDPRWFMKPAHMNPEEAVRAYRDLGAKGAFVAMHWGTFRLTDEAPLEPPVRLREAWRAEGLPPDDAHVLRHGETLVV